MAASLNKFCSGLSLQIVIIMVVATDKKSVICYLLSSALNKFYTNVEILVTLERFINIFIPLPICCKELMSFHVEFCIIAHRLDY